LLKEINEAVYSYYPDVQTIAEESTSFTGVSRPTYSGGLGFGMKWMMGWMHDTLKYFAKDPMYRKYHHNQITFSMVYAFTENFMLPFSHDEVVYGKGSMINKMPGDIWQRFANLRVLYSYMFTHPGAKLLFMGCDFAQIQEWNFERSLDWHLTEDAKHKGIQKTIRDLNKLYRKEAALYEKQFDPQGFEWLDANDWERGTLSYLRKGNEHTEPLLTVLNLTPVPREDYKLGVPDAGIWQILFNSDDEKYGGSDYLKAKSIESEPAESHGNTNSITFNLPPLAALVLKRKNN
ncbi:MAG: alpha amylase C-terminal domain-containing protein, partial [Bacteroidota bacterium]